MFKRTLSLALLTTAFLALHRASFPPLGGGNRQVQCRRPSPPAAGRNLPGVPLPGEPGEDLSLRALLAALTTDPDPTVREHAATALGALGEKGAGSWLAQVLLEDPNARVREHAAVALGRLGAEETRDALLLAMLTDTEHTVRRHAAETLGMMGR